MELLSKQVKLVDWSEQRIDQADLFKGLYVLFGSIIYHGCMGVLRELELTSGHSKLVSALWLIFCCTDPATNATLMLICGLQYRKKSMRGAVRTQLKYLWKPYLYTVLGTLAAVIIVTCLIGGDVWARVAQKVLPLVIGNLEGYDYFGIAMDGCGPMWFIVTFIVGGIMLNMILQIKEEPLQWITVILLYGLGTTEKTALLGLPVSLPFGLYHAMRYILYMYIGWQIKKKRFFDQRFPVWMLLMAAVFVIPSIYRLRVDAILIIIIIFANLAIYSRFQNVMRDKKNWFLDMLRWMGRHIMPFCCIHTVFYQAINWDVIGPLFAQKPLVGIAVLTAIFAVTGIGGCILLDCIKRRNIKKQ